MFHCVRAVLSVPSKVEKLMEFCASLLPDPLHVSLSIPFSRRSPQICNLQDFFLSLFSLEFALLFALSPEKISLLHCSAGSKVNFLYYSLINIFLLPLQTVFFLFNSALYSSTQRFHVP